MKLSICCITYNHEKYIGQALDGFLSQQTDFDFEIVVSDDFSKDGTAAILEAYADKYPGRLTLRLHKENIGMIRNFTSTAEACTGKYIALCEGDDYWTDPLKLQKQVNFMEANPGYAICFHKVNILKNGLFENDTLTRRVPETTTINDLAVGNFMHTCSVVYRNHLFEKFPEYMWQSPIGDYFLHMLNARFGSIKFIDETMGVYRMHDTSVWSAKKQQERNAVWVDFLKNIKPGFNPQVQQLLDQQIKISKNYKPGAKDPYRYFKRVKRKLVRLFK